MPWKPGQSGNPSGRRKYQRSGNQRRTITELARDIAPDALKTLHKVMLDKKSSSTARAIAADRILDRAYGKAPQAVAVVASIATRRAADLTDDELAAIIAGAAPTLLPPPDDPVIEGELVEEEERGNGVGLEPTDR